MAAMLTSPSDRRSSSLTSAAPWVSPETSPVLMTIRLGRGGDSGVDADAVASDRVLLLLLPLVLLIVAGDRAAVVAYNIIVFRNQRLSSFLLLPVERERERDMQFVRGLADPR